MEASLHDQTPFIKYPGSRDGAACCGRDCAGGSGGLERGTVERGEMVAASAGHTQCHARQDRRACAAQEPGGGSFACKSRRLPISCRRRQRSRLERATSGVRNSRTTAGRSSIDTSSVLRRTTATVSCKGRECCLKPVRRVAAVLHTVAMLPFVYGLPVCRENDSLDRFLILQTPEPLRQG